MKKGIFALLLAGLSAAPLVAQGRLFAVDYVVPQAHLSGRSYARPEGVAPQGLFGNIYELDPVTGAQLNQFDAPEYTLGAEGLAFDGQSLWFISSPLFGQAPDGGQGPQISLYELDPDSGAVLDSDVVPGLFEPDGLGVLNGLIYILEHQTDVVHVFDPGTDSLTGTIDIGAANPLRDFIGGLDGYPEGGLLLVTAYPLAGSDPEGDSHILSLIDPATGDEVDSFPLGGSWDTGVAALGTTIYTGEYGLGGGIDLYDPNGTLLDTFAVSYGVSGLAAGGGQPPPSVLEVPAINSAGAALLALALFAAAVVSLRRRRA